MPAPSLPPLKLAVIGAGVMGRNHLRAAKACDDFTLVAVADTDAAKAQDAATEFGCPAFAHADTLLATADAVVVAVPTAHHNIAVRLLEGGVHCLVEKPLALTERDCWALIEAGHGGGAVLQVGHIERFNPAAEALFARKIDPARIRALTARRMGPASARVTDIDVVMDLMVHDLDALLALKPMPIADVRAAGNADHAEAALTFGDGGTALVTASRVTGMRARDLHVVTQDGAFYLDFIGKRLLSPPPPGQNKSQAETFTGDALTAQLKDFAAAIRAKAEPRVSGESALAVMKLAWRIQEALRA